jgi:AraC-like DNA-binding protein
MTLLYENHGKLWTVKETKQLMKEVKIMEINHIALLHKRTPNAIFLKLIREASKIAEEEEDDITLEDLSVITSLSPSKLLEGFKRIKYTRFDDDNIDDNNDDNYDKKLTKRVFLKLVKQAAVLADEEENLTLNELSTLTSLSPDKLLEGFKEINYTKFDEEEKEEDNNSFDDEYKYDNLQRAIVFTLILGGAVYFFKEYLKYLQMDYN